ncbi:patatin-like phospholipase family protein [Clostridium septicum]|uniref:Phospholipase n=1 Tax=Clostridium septicum TaxID=1504 RepID=A0A9N7JKQ2_CLOSE|nr:patatin-like phospholipase family protein [Clostridium septicum]AYE34193.1 phospholipase [Clostridium septicum]MDU1315364.1 patatin-like phospholipase family protein [Clostridium septicum]QAS59557.1 patatin-like phospholipase family protein [Clostridium septicum]UEC21176.1 patatin-like phospholipase family protein [Clostridium septicum]USS00777.1 patatin-like phospholipase family protein [Clostridium septicum]
MKIGLVLAGGGARGAYQIGVWRALRELNIEKYVKVISGTSIGALNAVLFMKGDLSLAEEIWKNIKPNEILPINQADLKIRKTLLDVGIKNIHFIKKYIPKMILGGNISRGGLEKIIDNLELNFITDSDIRCYVTCTDIDKLEAKHFLINKYSCDEIKKILLASSAIPMIYEKQKVEGEEYLDGGIVDNVPIESIYDEVCDLLIIVHLSKESKIDKRKFNNLDIIEIVPSVVEDGALDGVLEFDSKISKERMIVGYDDTINTITPIIKLVRFLDKEENKMTKERNNIIKRIKNIFK